MLVNFYGDLAHVERTTVHVRGIVTPTGMMHYDAALHLVFQYSRVQKFLRKTPLQVRAGPVKRTETRKGLENSRTLPYGMEAASSLASNAMNLHPQFTLLCAKCTRDAGALCWRPKRRPPPFRM